MEFDFDDIALRGLQRYVRLVCQAMALRGECWYIQADETACVYIALDRRLSRFPDHDVALLWDENEGWSAATEAHSAGAELLVVARFGQDPLPPPEAVATWVAGLFDPHRELDHIGHSGERPNRVDTDETRRRLAAYAMPGHATTAAGEPSY
jgi:hypothetical protein